MIMIIIIVETRQRCISAHVARKCCWITRGWGQKKTIDGVGYGNWTL